MMMFQALKPLNYSIIHKAPLMTFQIKILIEKFIFFFLFNIIFIFMIAEFFRNVR